MLDHLNLTVNNFDASARWYRDLFGYTVVEKGWREGLPWGVLRRDSSMLCIYEDPEHQAPKHWTDPSITRHRINHFGLRIRDKTAWEERRQEAGIELLYGGPVRHPHSTAWYILDPSGHEIEVVHWDDDTIRFG